MTVQDFDWEAGAKLVDYQIQGEGEPVDANLRIQVKLNLGRRERANRRAARRP